MALHDDTGVLPVEGIPRSRLSCQLNVQISVRNITSPRPLYRLPFYHPHSQSPYKPLLREWDEVLQRCRVQKASIPMTNDVRELMVYFGEARCKRVLAGCEMRIGSVVE
jgi:hypothetical protein